MFCGRMFLFFFGFLGRHYLKILTAKKNSSAKHNTARNIDGKKNSSPKHNIRNNGLEKKNKKFPRRL